MTIVNQIIEALTNSEIPIQDTLLKIKVFAYKVKNIELQEFINNELEGYKTDCVPEFRKIVSPIIGTISNGYMQMKNVAIPVLHLDEGLRENLSTCYVTQSISSLESISKSSSEETMVKMVPPEAFSILSKSYSNGYVVQHAKVCISKDDLSGIVTCVKSKLLNIMLNVEQKIDEDSISKLFTDKKSLEKVNTIINNNIHNIFNSKDNSEQNIKIQQDSHNNS